MKDVDASLNALTERVIGAAIEVHRRLGPGFLESTYQKALSIELRYAGLAHRVEAPVTLTYRDEAIGEGRLDLLIEEKLIIELKAVDKLHPIHKAQVISYLKATGLEVALLINFNVEALRDGLQRLVLTSASSAPPRFQPNGHG